MRLKLFIVLAISMMVLVSAAIVVNHLITSSSPRITDNGAKKALETDLLKQRDKYFLVGATGCDFKTIKDALNAVNSSRKTILIKDKVLTEVGIVINKDVDIIGLGSDKTIVQGAVKVEDATDRVFLIEKNARVSLTGITVRNGKITKVPRCGGGIYNKGNLVIKNCLITNNMATYGVGINNEGILEMRDSTIAGNSGLKRPMLDQRNGVDCGGSGCGMKVEMKSVARLYGCLIKDNVSVANGGGIHISCEGKAILENCTIINNSAELEGGGISVRGDIEMTHCTITKNIAKTGDGVMARGRLAITGNIIYGNAKTDLLVGSGFGISGEGSIDKNEYNLIGDSSIKAFMSSDPKLQPLKDNGGSTMTCALKEESPAVDAIPTGKVLTKVDQRGISRLDGPADIGAYEIGN